MYTMADLARREGEPWPPNFFDTRYRHSVYTFKYGPASIYKDIKIDNK